MHHSSYFTCYLRKCSNGVVLANPSKSAWSTDPACGERENAATKSKQIHGQGFCWLLSAAQIPIADPPDPFIGMYIAVSYGRRKQQLAAAV